MNAENHFLRLFGITFRGALIILLALSFFSVKPAHAADLPNLTIINGDFALTGGNLVPLEAGRMYTIKVTNVGDVPTTGPATVVFSQITAPAGLTVTAMSGDGWDCTLGTLTCTRSDALNSQANYPIITVTVTVLVGARPEIISQAVVSGGGADDDPNNNTSSVTANVNAKPDLIITGYEFLNVDKSAVITQPTENQIFWIRMTLENVGGIASGSFYPGVFLDNKPNYGPDHDEPPNLNLGEVTDFQDYKITPPGSLEGVGCLYYDPNDTINPLTEEVLQERGNYTLVSFLPGLPAGTSTTVDVEIAYPLAQYTDLIYDADSVRTGLKPGSYSIYLYADPNCSGGDEESNENNNSFGPINLNISSVPLVSPWVGGVKVESDRNIITVGRPHTGTEVMTYNGFAGGSTTVYIPMLFKNMWTGYNAALYVQNVDAVGTANLTLKFYDVSGNLVCTKNDTLNALSSKGYWMPSETCLPTSWYGAVVITSDKNIVAVGRPHIDGQVTTYNGFATGSTTMYVPMLFKDAFGGDYDSALYVQNVTTNPANITIRYYNNSGGLDCTKTDTISQLSSKGYWLPTVTCNTGSLPVGWVGGVVVTSDQDIVAVGRPHIGTQVTTYSGFGDGGLSMSVPMLFKGTFGSYDSALYVQNVGSSIANITISFYDANGDLSCTKQDTVAVLASKGYWLPTITCSTGSLPAGWSGNAVVTSNQNIIAVGRPHLGTEVMTYNGSKSGDLANYIPMLFNNAFGSYNSAFYIQNLDPTNLALVTVKFYDASGNLSCTRQDAISPLASRGYWAPSVTCIP